jgi:acetyl esterase/lipase
MIARRNCLRRAARAVLAACAGLLGLSLDAQPAEAAGPGSIINVWPLDGGGPGNSEAFRILYRSTDPNGRPIEVSGAIYWNPGPAPAGGRDVIAWAHPTSGVVRACAPSLMPDNAGMIWGLADILAKGYVVVATDYPGLGTPGVHPYLIGASEARAVLDSVRAARNLPHTGASNRFAVWGHSQGGHAALFTGQLAASYAPELKLVGVAAAAPATYLIELFDADKATATGKELTAMALYSWTKLENISPATLVEPAAMGAFEKMAHDCIESVAEFKAITDAEKPLQHLKFLKVDPTEIEPWRSLMQQNTPGQAPTGAPIFIAQGTADTTVHPEITKQFGRALCKQGARVTFVWLNGVSHTFAARDSASETLRWIGDRFRGAPAPSSC